MPSEMSLASLREMDLYNSLKGVEQAMSRTQFLVEAHIRLSIPTDRKYVDVGAVGHNFQKCAAYVVQVMPLAGFLVVEWAHGKDLWGETVLDIILLLENGRELASLVWT